MSVWLSFLVSIFVIVAVSILVLRLIYVRTKKRKRLTSSKMGATSGEKPGQLGIWLTWDSVRTDLQFYRFVLKFFSPETEETEGRMTVTYDPPQKCGFFQTIELSKPFLELLQRDVSLPAALITVQALNTEETGPNLSFSLSKFKKLCRGEGAKVPVESVMLPKREADPPDITSLDYSEIQARKLKFERFEAEIRAKEAKKAAAAKAAEAKKAAMQAASAKNLASSGQGEKPAEPSKSVGGNKPEEKPNIENVEVLKPKVDPTKGS